MSATVLTTLVFGIEVTRSMFTATTGETRRVCEKGHERETRAPFCDQCGSSVSTVLVERPREAVKVWAEAHRRNPETLWEELFQEREGKAADDGEKAAIFEITPLQPYGRGERSYALGLCVTKLRAWEPGQEPRVINPVMPPEKTKLVLDLATGLGINGPMQFFLCLYFS